MLCCLSLAHLPYNKTRTSDHKHTHHGHANMQSGQKKEEIASNINTQRQQDAQKLLCEMFGGRYLGRCLRNNCCRKQTGMSPKETKASQRNSGETTRTSWDNPLISCFILDKATSLVDRSPELLWTTNCKVHMNETALVRRTGCYLNQPQGVDVCRKVGRLRLDSSRKLKEPRLPFTWIPSLYSTVNRGWVLLKFFQLVDILNSFFVSSSCYTHSKGDISSTHWDV